MKNLKIKICGMRTPSNVLEVAQLPVDYMGFIFYEKSKRCITKNVSTQNKNIQRVGVFVNETLEVIKDKILDHQLDLVQLHGDESPDFCKEINTLYVDVIKVFSVDDAFDFKKTKPYEPYCDYFLFDTKGKDRGGNGVTFNWSILEKYQGLRPFFLSGGIAPESIDELQNLKHEKLYALDLNSKFEDQPALKNIEKLKKFIDDLQH